MLMCMAQNIKALYKEWGNIMHHVLCVIRIYSIRVVVFIIMQFVSYFLLSLFNIAGRLSRTTGLEVMSGEAIVSFLQLVM